ncbi:hypothetical protein CALVIDRAFT_561047 [Calocera viscosa TUFC12733]|uniref:Protein kinase domain-containing protein n=1 Tax=Calocera viscosa (strain TUFC12733) TaxID=1330018 RepID=A0A167QFR8_CALVF|nr:hypothetical protein CALVIDRAFT_561047 [Calocera viscosa TUFC12733]
MFPHGVKLPMKVSQVFDLAFDMSCHKRDILHCDIKPHNILLRPARAGVPARTVLCDFGLSRSLSRAAVEENIYTVGTFDYTSLASHAHKALVQPGTVAQSRAQYLYLAQVKAAWSGQALSAGYPSIFGAILDYARILRPRELPRYDLIRKALQEAQDGREDSLLAHEDGQLRPTIKTGITEEDIALLPTLTDKDDPVIDPTIDWETFGSPDPGYPPPSNSRDGYMDEFVEPQGELHPSLSLPQGMSGQLTEVWDLIYIKNSLWSAGDSP